MSYGPVSLIEIAWTLSALPGLWIWVVNRIAAGHSLRAVRLFGLTNGRALWARFSVLLTTVFIIVEALFVVIGVAAMFRDPNPTPTESGSLLISLVLTAGLIGGSALVSFVGYRWRAVDRDIITMIHRRKDSGV